MNTTTAQITALSPRERETLTLMARGLRNAEVAATMQIGTETVKSHLRSIYRKLGVTNRVAAVAILLARDVATQAEGWTRADVRIDERGRVLIRDWTTGEEHSLGTAYDRKHSSPGRQRGDVERDRLQAAAVR